jgi:hypothetical protein
MTNVFEENLCTGNRCNDLKESALWFATGLNGILESEVFTAVTMKNAVFRDIKTQSVLHRRHITEPILLWKMKLGLWYYHSVCVSPSMYFECLYYPLWTWLPGNNFVAYFANPSMSSISLSLLGDGWVEVLSRCNEFARMNWRIQGASLSMQSVSN